MLSVGKMIRTPQCPALWGERDGMGWPALVGTSTKTILCLGDAMTMIPSHSFGRGCPMYKTWKEGMFFLERFGQLELTSSSSSPDSDVHASSGLPFYLSLGASCQGLYQWCCLACGGVPAPEPIGPSVTTS